MGWWAIGQNIFSVLRSWLKFRWIFVEESSKKVQNLPPYYKNYYNIFNIFYFLRLWSSNDDVIV